MTPTPQMTPQPPKIAFDGRDGGAQTETPNSFVSIQPMIPASPSVSARRELTAAERQGLAMSWVAITLGMLLLLGGLALWAAAVFSAGFGGWLIAMGLLGLVMVAVVTVVSIVVLRPRR